jgi:hypothetical protein
VTDGPVDLCGDEGLDRSTATAMRRLAIEGFWALWEGNSPRVRDLGDTGEAVDDAVDHLRAHGRIEVSAEGHLVAVHGLTRRDTSHRIVHAGGSINTWCALDAIGIPAALAIDARAHSRCPTCDRELVVALTGGVPAASTSTVLWYPAGPCDRVVDDFCTAANLFCSADHLDVWHTSAGSLPGRPMAMSDVAAVGRDCWRDAANTPPASRP